MSIALCVWAIVAFLSYVGSRWFQVFTNDKGAHLGKVALCCLFWPISLIFLISLVAAIGWTKAADDFRIL